MADNTKPDPTKTYDARFSSNLTASQIASSTDKRDKLVIASDTEDVTIVTKTQKRNIPFDAEANAVNSVNGEVGAVVLDLGEDNNISDANATALTDGGETDLHSHAGGSILQATEIGDSITEGDVVDSAPWDDYVTKSDRTFANIAVGGYTTTNVREWLLLRAIGEFNFNFEQGYFPFESNNDSVLSIDDAQFIIAHGGTADGGASMVPTIGSKGTTISGNAVGDGTSIPVIKNLAGTVLWTGTSSVTEQSFSFAYNTVSNTDVIDLVCSAGTAGNFVKFYNLKIEITDKNNVSESELFSLCGINDLGASVDIEVVMNNHNFIAQQAFLAGIDAVAIGITPLVSWYSSRPDDEAIRREVNRRLQYESDYKYFIPNEKELAKPDAGLFLRYQVGDGTHLSLAGAERLGNTVQDWYTSKPVTIEQGNAKFIQNIEIDGDIPDVDDFHNSLLIGKKYQNILVESEDISQSSAWFENALSAISPTEILASTTASTQYIRNGATLTTPYSYSKIKAGAAQWVSINSVLTVGGRTGIIFDTGTLAVTLVYGTPSGYEITTDGTYIYVIIDYGSATGTGISYFLCGTSGGYAGYAGDGSTVDLEIHESQMMEDPTYEYIKTLDVNEEGKRKFKVINEGATGTFTSVTTVGGLVVSGT